MEKYLSKINNAIERLPLPDEPQRLYEPISYTMAGGGKRLRPVLTLMTCDALGGSLDEAGLAAAITALNSFKTANGVPLASDNLLLVCGSKLSPIARKLANAGYVDFQNGTAYPNVFKGRFTPKEWAYFDAAHARAKKDDGSTASLFAGEKTWILLRDPQRRPAVCVSKVLGFESPRIEQFDTDPNVWGTTYRYVYPYGVGIQYKDAICAVTNS